MASRPLLPNACMISSNRIFKSLPLSVIINSSKEMTKVPLLSFET